MVGGLKGRGAITASATEREHPQACYRISFNYRRTCWYCGALSGRSLVRAQLSQLLLECKPQFDHWQGYSSRNVYRYRDEQCYGLLGRGVLASTIAAMLTTSAAGQAFAARGALSGTFDLKAGILRGAGRFLGSSSRCRFDVCGCFIALDDCA